ncbi:hypothetical protein D9613_002482 [Agrocybe pediades]|uniref:Uncharacterized protein n=1 Tax=Agrocybe pediades TaxID=84607 RepID=A0A8H4QPH2_9AGAR|nr:hypothetical protein D9613_002482 [Agrocybe pediades]
MDINLLLHGARVPPAKRRGYMDVWDHIASLVPKQTQHALSLVNKKFADVMRKHIFKELTLQVEREAYKSDDDVLMYRRYNLRQRHTIQRLIGISMANFAPLVLSYKVTGASTIRHFVQRWVGPFETLNEDGLDIGGDHPNLILAQYYSAVIPVFFATLGQYTGLQTLWLEHVELGISTQPAFASLKNLANLILRNVLFLAPFNPSVKYALRLLELSDIKVPDDWEGPEPLASHFCTPFRLQILLLEKLYNPFITSLGVINAIGQNDESFFELSILEVTLQKAHVPSFFTLLSRFFQLVSLRIRTAPRDGKIVKRPGRRIEVDGEDNDEGGKEATEEWEENVPIHIAAYACLTLNHFSGPLKMAKMIVPGRPINSLQIQDDGYAGICRSFGEIKELLDNLSNEHMRILIYDGCQTGQALRLLQYVSKRFQGLKTLRILVFDYPNDVLPSCEEYCDQRRRTLRGESYKEESRSNEDEDGAEEASQNEGRDEGRDREEDGGENQDDNIEGRLGEGEVDSKVNTPRSPFRLPNTGELNIEDHYREGYLVCDTFLPPETPKLTKNCSHAQRLLAEVATGMIRLPETLESLEIVESQMFKRQTYSRAHIDALMAEIERNSLHNKLRVVRIGMDNALDCYWKDGDGGWQREDIVKPSGSYVDCLHAFL